MKKIALALALAIAFALISCEDEIDFSGREPGQKVVLNCLAQADSMLTARVTLTRFFLNNDPHQPVADAQLSLWANGTQYAAMGDGQGNYAFPYIPQCGDTLRLTLRCSQTDSLIMGQTIVPQRPVLSQPTLSIDTTYRPLEFLDTCIPVYRIAFQMQPPEGEAYFRMRILCDVKGDTIDQPDQRAVCFQPADFLTQGSTWLFTNESFNSLKDTIQFLIAADSLERTHFRLVVESLSPEFFRYALTYSSQQGVNMGSEPANIPTNLTGGALGLLGSAAKTVAAVPFSGNAAATLNRQQKRSCVVPSGSPRDCRLQKE